MSIHPLNEIGLGFGFGGGQPGGFHMSFGIGRRINCSYKLIVLVVGAFPFGFFATNFNFGEERPGPPQVLNLSQTLLCRFPLIQAGSHQAAEEAFLHKIFLWVRSLLIFLFCGWINTFCPGGICLHILVADRVRECVRYNLEIFVNYNLICIDTIQTQTQLSTFCQQCGRLKVH